MGHRAFDSETFQSQVHLDWHGGQIAAVHCIDVTPRAGLGAGPARGAAGALEQAEIVGASDFAGVG